MKTSQTNNRALVVFGKDFSRGLITNRKFDTIVADKIFQKKVEDLGCQFVEIDTLIDSGSIYEADTLLKELSGLTFHDGKRISKSFTYKGYELWWMNHGSIFLYFCLPYTQYKKLLKYLKNFQSVSFLKPPYKSLFSSYLSAYGCKFSTLKESKLRSSKLLPFGVFLQIFITLLSIPILIVGKRRIVLFTGDKFEKNKDYDFRMKFIYKELRKRNLPFVEFIRSLESWKTVLKHAIKRRRPVIYPQGVIFIGRFMSIISGGRRRAKAKFGAHTFVSVTDPEEMFKFLVATQYILTVYDDIWSIRIMKLILRIIGIKATLITAATERSFQTILGCKLNNIPTVGILHGVVSCYSAPYDFMPGFDGEKMLSVDKYGLWSEWWKEYYVKNSKAYKPEQLHVSGPMRPLEVSKKTNIKAKSQDGPVRVLFIAEQTVAPNEAMPYLRKLLDQQNIELTIKFRPYHDGFEEWIIKNESQILKLQHIKIIKGGMQVAIQDADVVVGARSTGVLEALLQFKIPIFLRTRKWGDYYNLTKSNEGRHFFAENPTELIEKINGARAIPHKLIIDMSEKYFGDVYKNGSKWVIDSVENFFKKS